MASTFFTDGYRDALAGNPYAPPYHPQTTAYAREYQEGYNAAFETEADRAKTTAAAARHGEAFVARWNGATARRRVGGTYGS